MLSYVRKRVCFPSSIRVLTPSAAGKTVKKVVKHGTKKGAKGRVSSNASLSPVCCDATAVLLTEQEVRAMRIAHSSEQKTTKNPAASALVGFHGKLGDISWTCGLPGTTRAAAESSAPQPTLLVGLTRGAKQAELLRRSMRAREKEEEQVDPLNGKRMTVAEYRRVISETVRACQKSGEVSTLQLNMPSEGVEVTSTTDLFHAVPYALTAAEVAERTATFAVTGGYRYSRKHKQSEELKSKENVKSESVKRGKGKKPSSAVRAESGAGEKTGALQQIVINTPHTEDVMIGALVGNAVNEARNLGNLREDEGTPAFFVEWMLEKVKNKRGVRVQKVLEGKRIEEAGLNLLYNVGRGSVHKPMVLVVEYVGAPKSAESIALVGKGVCFDSGGLNVKPYGSMETMHTDMMGAAVVLNAFDTAVELQLPVNLVAAVGFVENAIGPQSYHPGCIIPSLAGPTVEVRNTDAEGRLVLADLFSYVLQTGKLPRKGGVNLVKKPTTLIDLATLTGSIVIGLGEHRAGCFSNHSALSSRLMQAGTWCGEELWPMPIGLEHLEAVQGSISDLINTPPGRAGGSCTAAAFLSHFVPDKLPWAHLDIAGPSDVGNKGRGPVHPPGATGFGVQLLAQYLRAEASERNAS